MKLGELLQLVAHVFGVRREEGPAYEVLLRDGSREIRRYSGYLIAKTTVPEGDDASNNAFRILAGYIFGKNRGSRQIAMTAPVLQERRPAGETIAMTAPVLQEARDGAWSMAFAMPSGFTRDTLPEPLDDSVTFDEMPPKEVASLRFSGRAERADAARKAEELRQWLSANGRYRPVSEARLASYDPPWTLPFLRRNEVHLDVEPAG